MNLLALKDNYAFSYNILVNYIENNFGCGVSDVVKIISWYYINCYGKNTIISQSKYHTMISHNGDTYAIGPNNITDCRVGEYAFLNQVRKIDIMNVKLIGCDFNYAYILTNDGLYKYNFYGKPQISLNIMYTIDELEKCGIYDIKQISCGMQ